MLYNTIRYLFCCFFLAGPWIAAQNPNVLTINRLQRPPTLADFAGMEVRGETARAMAHVSGFIQREPADGQAASHDTDVYLGYDDKHLYAVFLAWDSEADKIRATLSPRGSVFNDDYVDIQIDTFNDQRRGYTFLSTSRGIQWDAIWTEGNQFDDSFQALWHSEGEITDRGYMVLISLPFSSMRFPKQAGQTWGILFNRNIARLGESSFWPRYSTRIEGRLNQAGRMKGIENISPGRNIQVNPYIFARRLEVLNRDTAQFEQESFEVDGGLDAKMVIRDSFVLDVTGNPDFSQVESDEPQVTVNQRFEVRFPERRPFFLENADFFNTFTSLVFTRRIVDPRYGVRFTGKKSGWSLGMMTLDDEAPGKGRAPDDPLTGERAQIGIIRINRDLAGQSTLGLLYTQREFGDDYNRVYALDSRLKLNPNWIAQLQVAGARTREAGQPLEGNAYNAMLNRSGHHFETHNHFLRTDPNFRTRLGFLKGEQRANSMNVHNHSSYTFRPENSLLAEWGPGMEFGRTWDTDGKTLDTFFEPEIAWELKNNTQFGLEYDYNRQRFTPTDYAQLATDIELAEAQFSVEYESSYFAKISFEAEIGWGKSINFLPLEDQPPALGDITHYRLNLNWRPLAPLRLDADLFFVELHDESSNDLIFRNKIFRFQGNWQFTRELSARLIVQSEQTTPNGAYTRLERERNLNSDLLIRYVLNPWTAAYLGYNANRSNFEIMESEDGPVVLPTSSALNQDGEQFFLKFSYLFQY